MPIEITQKNGLNRKRLRFTIGIVRGLRKGISVKKIFLCVLVCFSSLALEKIYVVHPEAATGKPFNPGSPWYNVQQACKKLGYDAIWVKSARGLTDYAYIIYYEILPGELNIMRQHPKEKMIAFLWEPPTVNPKNYDANCQKYFSKIVTWDDSLVDNKRFFKFFYPVYKPVIKNTVPFEQKKFAVMMNRNKDSSHYKSLYGERRKLINFFEQNYSDDFDLYGYGWQSAGFKNYKGTVGYKIGCIKQYKFYFAYENMHKVDGYVTEKIFDGFQAGTVPIYWGAENVTDYIPENCFIDRRKFASDTQLYWFLKNMTEQEYEQYLQNIKDFLASDLPFAYRWDFFIHRFLSVIEPGYDLEIALTENQKSVVESVLSKN